MDKFKIYYLNSKYYDYLNKNNFLDQMMNKEGRPHIGFVQLWTNNINRDFGYVIPLVSSKSNIEQKLNKYQKLIEYEVNGEKQYSILKIDKMIPVLNNDNFIEKVEEEKLRDRELAQLEQLNLYSNKEDILNLSEEIRKQRYKFNFNHFKKIRDIDLLFSIDYPLADQLAINYNKSLYQSDINDLVKSYKDLNASPKLVERKYFRSDFDHISALKNPIWIRRESNFDEYEKNHPNKEELKELMSHNSSLRKKLHQYYLQSKYLNNIEKEALMAFWIQENEIVNQKDKFFNLQYQSIDYFYKKTFEKFFSSDNSKTKFYFENDDFKIWYGWKNKESNFRTIVVINKDNHFAADGRSVSFSHYNASNQELYLGLFKIFKSFPHQFKSIFDKYGYPYNQELFYQRQIDNLNQQLDRYTQKPHLLKNINNPDLLERLNNFKKMREEQLIDIRRDWQTYLESQGLIDQKDNKENIFKFEAPKQITNIKHTESKDETKKPSWLTKREAFIEDLIQRIEEDPQKWNWEQLWTNIMEPPMNYVTNAKYHGWNSLHLAIQMEKHGWKDPRFITYNQAKKANIWIDTKNYKPIQLEKFIFEKEEKSIDPETGEETKILVKLNKPIVSVFHVYNVEACKDIAPFTPKVKEELKDPERDLVYEILKSSSVVPVIENHKIKTPHYDPEADQIVVPETWQYKNSLKKAPYQQISVLIHEMSHSTGHKNRLNRWEQNTDHDDIFGSPAYAKEELVAQFSTIFTMKELNLPTNQFEQKNDINYIKGWKKALKNHPNLFFQAITEAEKSADYLYANYLKTIDRMENQLKDQAESKNNHKKLHSSNSFE